ncbi:hypothetical protein Q5752_001630 [Cryptotrichosporon argae]
MPLIPNLKRRVTRPPSHRVYPPTPPDSPDPSASGSSLWVHVRGKSLSAIAAGPAAAGGAPEAVAALRDPATDAFERAIRKRRAAARAKAEASDEMARTPPTTPPSRILNISAPVPLVVPPHATVDLDVALKHRSLDLAPPSAHILLGSPEKRDDREPDDDGDTAAALAIIRTTIPDEPLTNFGSAADALASFPAPASTPLAPSLSSPATTTPPLPTVPMLARSQTMPLRSVRNPTRPSRNPARPSLASTQSDVPTVVDTEPSETDASAPPGTPASSLARSPSLMRKLSPRKGSLTRSTRKALGLTPSLSFTPASPPTAQLAAARPGSAASATSSVPPASGKRPAPPPPGARSALAAELAAFEAVLDAQLQTGAIPEHRYLALRAELRRMVKVVRDEGTSELKAVGVLRGYIEGVYAGARRVSA